MYCGNCGARIEDEEARFCPECGTTLYDSNEAHNVQKRNDNSINNIRNNSGNYNRNDSGNYNRNYNRNDSGNYNRNYNRNDSINNSINDNKNDNKKNSKKNNSSNNNTLVLVALAAGMAVIICALIVFIIVKATERKPPMENNNNGAVAMFTASPTATPTPIPTVTLTPTAASDHRPEPASDHRSEPASEPSSSHTVAWEDAVNSRVISDVNGSYKRYTNTAYNFSCLFPADAEVFNDGTKSLWSVSSSDGGVVTIGASEATESVSDGKQRYINQKGGTIDYQNSGSDFYAVRIANSGKYHYRYCKYANGNMYWFEVDFPGSAYSRYDTIINDMYQSLKY